MQALFGSDEGSDTNPDFSDDSSRRMAARLNGMLGLPKDEPASDVTGSTRTSTTGIPFIDTHFPSRRRDALSKLEEFGKGLRDGLQSLPRIGVQIDEDDDAYLISMTCSGVSSSEQKLDVALEEGVLMLTLQRDKEADASSKVLIPVPLPADAGREIGSVTRDEETVTVRVSKDPTRTRHGSEKSTADESEEEEEMLERLTSVLKALGLSLSADMSADDGS